ncbi:unnamed protein product, partial [Polarella glacialis]
MNRNKALLDSLMGPSRNVSKKDKGSEPEFLRDDVCKSFLIGYCPDHALAKKIEEGRAEFDRESILRPCTKIHAIGLREEFKAHKDCEKYKGKYEESLYKLVQKAVDEVESKVAHEYRKRDEMNIQPGSSERMCDLCGTKYKLMKADINVADLSGNPFKPDDHEYSDLHKGYVKLRAKYDELHEKMREADEAKTKAREESETRRAAEKAERAEKKAARAAEKKEKKEKEEGKEGEEGEEGEEGDSKRKRSGSREKRRRRRDDRE